jgi:hypothetical protein
MCCIEYISSERGSNSTLVVMGTDCICSYKSNYHKIKTVPKITTNRIIVIFTFFQILKTAIGNCLRSCSRMNVESVAFPAVGSGQLLGYPIDHVIDCLINESGGQDVVHIKSREVIQIMQCNHITLYYTPFHAK